MSICFTPSSLNCPWTQLGDSPSHCQAERSHHQISQRLGIVVFQWAFWFTYSIFSSISTSLSFLTLLYTLCHDILDFPTLLRMGLSLVFQEPAKQQVRFIPWGLGQGVRSHILRKCLESHKLSPVQTRVLATLKSILKIQSQLLTEEVDDFLPLGGKGYILSLTYQKVGMLRRPFLPCGDGTLWCHPTQGTS